MKININFRDKTFITGLSIFIIALFLRVWRFSEAPDIHVDEIIYNAISNNLLNTGKMTYVGSVPWFVHPPLYFLSSAAYLSIISENGVTFGSIYKIRILSGISSAIMILIVFLFMDKIRDKKTAIIISMILALDPFLLKYGRFGLLESTALMFVILSIYLFHIAEISKSFGNYIIAGFFLGLTLLTKEMTAYIIISFIIYIFFIRYLLKTNINFRGISIFFGIALMIYMIYAAWGLSTNVNSFIGTKSYLIKRITGVIIDTGYLREGYPSLTKDILDTFWVYGTTHIFVLSSIPTSLYLLLKERKKEIILMVSWLWTSLLFIGFIRIHNEQFYGYIILPAIIINGLLISSIINRKLNVSTNFNIVISTLLLFIIVYNGYVWMSLYGIGTDTAYRQSIEYIRTNIPEGTKLFINPTARYFLPEYQLYFGKHSVNGLRLEGVKYFIISPRHYYMVNSATLDYVLRNGRLVASFEGHSLRRVDIYYLPRGI